MTERTDQERFAWCFLRGVSIEFLNFREKGVEIEQGIGPAWRKSRAIRSSKHAITAWRKCVDELMDREEES